MKRCRGKPIDGHHINISLTTVPAAFKAVMM